MSTDWSEFAGTYDDSVYSITRYPKKNKRIINRIEPGKRTAIVGYGSATYLQRQILANVDIASLAINDSDPNMIKVSQSGFSHPKLTHLVADTRYMPFSDGAIDYVISTNSVLPETRDEVCQLFRSIGRIGNTLIAYLPSFDMNDEFKARFPEEDWLKLDYEQMRVWDTGAWQCYHTRDTLTRELGEAGFSKITFEKVGAESPDELHQLADLYGERFAIHLWEYFVVAEKARKRYSALLNPGSMSG